MASAVLVFAANDTARYFSVLEAWNRTWVIAKREHRKESHKAWDYLVLWECEGSSVAACDDSVALTDWRSLSESNAAHNAAWFVHNGEMWGLGGRDDPHRHARTGVAYLARFGSPDAAYRRAREASSSGSPHHHAGRALPPAFRGSHDGCVERRPSFQWCEFDGRFSVARLGENDWFVYARANLVSEATRDHFGGRHVQVATFDPGGHVGRFELVRFVGYPDNPSTNDNVYFAAVNSNPADPTSLLALVPVAATTIDPCVAMAVSHDGVRFSRLEPVFKSRRARDGRTTDHPADGLLLRDDAVFFFIHTNVPDIANSTPAALLRFSIPLAFLKNYTARALAQLRRHDYHHHHRPDRLFLP